MFDEQLFLQFMLLVKYTLVNIYDTYFICIKHVVSFRMMKLVVVSCTRYSEKRRCVRYIIFTLESPEFYGGVH